MKHLSLVHLIHSARGRRLALASQRCAVGVTVVAPWRTSALLVQRREISSASGSEPRAKALSHTDRTNHPGAVSTPVEGASPSPQGDSRTLAFVYAKVPSFYVAVAQVARQLPEEMLSPLGECAVGDRRGLSAFLALHPLCFELSVLGRVTVVRRRDRGGVCGGDGSADAAANSDLSGGEKESRASGAAAGPEKVAATPASLTPKLPAQDIEPYEWYRAARLLPSTHTEVRLSAELEKEAADLLPAGHDLLSVCLSAPSLFAVRVANNEGAGKVDDAPPAVYLRFLLSPHYGGTSALSAEVLQRKLNDAALPRKKKRTLTRELACKQNPLPYLDERVMAHYLFDILPPDTYISRAELLNQLPRDIFACLPTQLQKIWEGYPHLFTIVQLDRMNEIALQRADLPPPKSRRVEDVALEEVLMELFNRYPVKRHPCVGTNLYRCLNNLPRLMQERVYAIKDVEREFVCAFPDKIERVEVPPIGDPTYEAIFPLVNPPHSQLVQASGRSDLFVPFRFVGEWYAQLERRYAKLCVRHKVDPNSTFVVDHIKRK